MVIRKRDEPRERGLPSLNEARAERRRTIVLGKARMPALPPYFWLWVAIGIAAFAVIYWRFAQGQLESQKSVVMAKQRAIAKTLGPKILPFRDRVEAWAQELAANYRGKYVADGVTLERISRSPGVYLRLLLRNSRDARSIRKSAQSSLLDGFTSCFFVRTDAPDPTKGSQCRAIADCEPGLLCNEYRVCARPPQPYNMRLAYRALRVLSTEWTDELHQAGSDLAVSAYDRDLEKVTRYDVPIGIEVLTRARYFTLVLDEEPEAGLPRELPDAGETPEERLQRVGHPARVGIWDLKSARPVVLLRTQAVGRFVPVGDNVVRGQDTIAAQQRQANNCGLALEVKESILQKRAEPEP